MGRLINQAKRARAKAARAGRRERILAAATRSFDRQPYLEISVDRIGHQAGERQGGASLFFASREELFLAVLGQELDCWTGAASRELTGKTGRSRAELAAALASTLVAHRVLCRLLSLAPVALEQGADLAAATSFVERRERCVAALGAELERSCGELGDGEGAALVERVVLVATALEPVCGGRGALVIGSGGASGRRRSFAAELDELVGRLVERPGGATAGPKTHGEQGGAR